MADAKNDTADATNDTAFHVAHAGSLAHPGARVHVRPGGRRVTVLRAPDGELRCLDSVCYHGGGPLGQGPIEEVDGRSCIVCPWHTYKVTLDGGEKLYRESVPGPDGKLVAGGWKSAGVRQRCHLAYERDGEVFVELSTEPAELASDKYACRPER